jgi:uncharacterized protein YbjT (DUF2867 family)
VCNALAVPEISEVPFAVFGATGQHGGAVVDALLERGRGAERDSGIPRFESKRLVEKALADVVPASFVRPTFFLENLTRALSFNQDPDLVLRLPMRGAVSVQMIAVRDIGIVSAAALLDPALLPEGSIEIAGDALSADAIAERIGEHLGNPELLDDIVTDLAEQGRSQRAKT